MNRRKLGVTINDVHQPQMIGKEDNGFDHRLGFENIFWRFELNKCSQIAWQWRNSLINDGYPERIIAKTLLRG